MRQLIISLFVCSSFIGCEGKAPPDHNGPDAAAGTDADTDGGVATSALVSGKAMDYFGGVAVTTATVATDGIDPQAAAISAADGSYSLTIAVGSKLFLVTSHPTTPPYRTTRNAALAVADMPVMQDAYMMASADVSRQYSSVGLVATGGDAFVTAELQQHDGTPLVGIPLANVTLLDAANAPVTGVGGPYFYGTVGDIDATVTTATAYGTPPRSRVAFLNVPPGSYTMSVTYPGGAATVTDTTLITTEADGATLALSGGTSTAASALPPNPDPTFATDIYPMLQRASKGGLGCGSCHTALGPAAVLPYDADPTTVLANMTAAGVIVLATPATSLFLTMPLYEQPPTPQNHPNATFLDITDPNYKMFLLWITNGAKP